MSDGFILYWRPHQYLPGTKLAHVTFDKYRAVTIATGGRFVDALYEVCFRLNNEPVISTITLCHTADEMEATVEMFRNYYPDKNDTAL